MELREALWPRRSLAEHATQFMNVERNVRWLTLGRKQSVEIGMGSASVLIKSRALLKGADREAGPLQDGAFSG